MANFNKKVMCLFKKEREQLIKEARRRGITFENTEQAIAEIIWKDAYDAGHNEGVIEGRNQSVSAMNNMKPEVREYCFHDVAEDIKYRFELTDEQVRVIEWMMDNEFLTNVNFYEWCDTFENVGRI